MKIKIIFLISFFGFFALSAVSQAMAYDMMPGLYDYAADSFGDTNTCWPIASSTSTSTIPVPFEFLIAKDGTNLSMTETTGSAGAFPVMDGTLSDNMIVVGPASKIMDLRSYEEANPDYTGNPGEGNCYLIFNNSLSGILTSNNAFNANFDLKITEKIPGGCSEFYNKFRFPNLNGGSCNSIVVGHASIMPSDALTQNWTPVWSDEFNGSVVDASKWVIEDGALMRESFALSANNVRVENGHLRIRTEKKDYLGKNYISGKVHTLGKFSLLYGRIDIRAKFPSGNGLWPALWLMPEHGLWPPEVDIIENYGNKPDTIYMTNHWMTLLKLMLNIDYRRGVTYAQEMFQGPNFSQGFHVFSIEWSPGEIRWFVDGFERAKSKRGIPKAPMYIIMNTALGAGEWGKNPDSTTISPQYNDIDYVRVYDNSPKKDTIAPSISGATASQITTDTATITWMTNEPADGQAEFWIGGGAIMVTPVVADFSAAHTINFFNLTSGATYYYRVKSKDPSGNLRTSSTYSFKTIDNMPPTVSLIIPADNAVVANISITSASASDTSGISKVEFYRDNNILIGVDTYKPYLLFWNSKTAANGTHTIFTKAFDKAGNSAISSSVSITISNIPDTISPKVSITKPRKSALIGGNVTVSASASDNGGVERVEFYKDSDSVPFVTDTLYPFSASLDTKPLQNGVHTVFAKVYDGAGNGTSSSAVIFTTDNTPPVISLIAPADNATISGQVILSASASDTSGISKVEFYRDNNIRIGWDYYAFYTHALNTKYLTAGIHTLFAKAYDKAGNVASSQPVVVTVGR